MAWDGNLPEPQGSGNRLTLPAGARHLGASWKGMGMAAEPEVSAAAIDRLTARIGELEHERKHLLAVIEILEEISGSLHFVDILQTIARKLGEAFGLDRASIFLAERGGRTARLVASYEDPSIRNHIVDLERYPELKRAMKTGQTVFIADAAIEPTLQHARSRLADRRVQSITVVPITWRRAAIGAIFLRTFRDGPQFSDADIRFVQVVASLTGKALRNAHRYERLLERASGEHTARPGPEIERAALLEFLRRLLHTFHSVHAARIERLLSESSNAELDRMVGVAMQVFAEEARGR